MRASLALAVSAAACLLFAAPYQQTRAQALQSVTNVRSELADALPASEWNRVDASIERALEWLERNQNPDGSFPTMPSAQPAVTSLCVMAFLSTGEQPGAGPRGELMNRAIDFVLDCQSPAGLFSYSKPESRHVHVGASHTATYNHAIAGLMLCEVYGHVGPERSARIAPAIDKAIRMTARIQLEPKKLDPVDRGGWRYLHRPGSFTPSDSDLSVTGWHLMFLRSAKNAQFDVPDQMVNEAVKYVERCFDPQQGGFIYGLIDNDRHVSRGMMGVGALSLAMAGKHNTVMARRAGDWILQHPFNVYGQTTQTEDRFHYSAYYCSNAMAQLGGRYWNQFFPIVARTLLDAQSPDGSWTSEIGRGDEVFGTAYPTALSVLTLTPAYQLLPIYQR